MSWIDMTQAKFERTIRTLDMECCLTLGEFLKRDLIPTIEIKVIVHPSGHKLTTDLRHCGHMGSIASRRFGFLDPNYLPDIWGVKRRYDNHLMRRARGIPDIDQGAHQ